MKSKIFLLAICTFLPLISSCTQEEGPLEGYDITFHMYISDGSLKNKRVGINVSEGESFEDKFILDPYYDVHSSGWTGALAYPVGYYLNKQMTRKIKASEIVNYDGSIKEIWAQYSYMNDFDTSMVSDLYNGEYINVKGLGNLTITNNHFDYHYNGYHFECDGVSTSSPGCLFTPTSVKVNNEDYVSSYGGDYLRKTIGQEITEFLENEDYPFGLPQIRNTIFSYNCFFMLPSTYFDEHSISYNTDDFYFNCVNNFSIEYDL